MYGEQIRKEMIDGRIRDVTDSISTAIKSVAPTLPEFCTYDLPTEDIEKALLGLVNEIFRQIREPNPF